jgi:hypothetical protein
MKMGWDLTFLEMRMSARVTSFQMHYDASMMQNSGLRMRFPLGYFGELEGFAEQKLGGQMRDVPSSPHHVVFCTLRKSLFPL